MRYDRVFVHALNEPDLFEDVFAPLSRDSAGLLEVSIRLQKSLATLGQLGYAPFRTVASFYAARSLQFTDMSVKIESDRQHLASIAQWRLAST